MPDATHAASPFSRMLGMGREPGRPGFEAHEPMNIKVVFWISPLPGTYRTTAYSSAGVMAETNVETGVLRSATACSWCALLSLAFA